MITFTIFMMFVTALSPLLLTLPSFTIEIPSVVYGPLFDMVNMIGYIFPVKALLPILGISFSVKSAQIVWSLILRFKSFIPTMGA